LVLSRRFGPAPILSGFALVVIRSGAANEFSFELARTYVHVLSPYEREIRNGPPALSLIPIA
jgi:hypothetical protein